MSYLLGIDVGTSNVKAVLFDLQGEEVSIARRKNEPIYLSDNRVEQDMNHLWDKVKECLVEIVDKDNKDKIKGIGLTGQGEGCWLVDKAGEPVDHSILWNDGRSGDIVNEIIEDEELFQELYEHTGVSANMGLALVQLLWTKKHKEENLKKADKIVFAKDWIRYKLTGKLEIEASDSATSLLNIETLEFESELFDKVGLSDYKHLVNSDINNSYEIAGNVKEDVANEIGLPADVPVAYGAIDVVATTLGVGAIYPGDMCTILGTTSATAIVTDDIRPGEENTRFEKHVIDDLYVHLMPTMSGTTNIDWMYENIADNLSYKDVDEKLLDLPPVPTGVIYHPYISTSGERTPFFDVNARSSLFGMSMLTEKMDIIKSIYEGISFSIKDSIQSSQDINEDSVIYLAGGGAASTAWKQIIVDTTGLTVVESKGSEFAAKGAVIGLAVTLGLFENYEEASSEMCRSVEIYQPNAKNVAIYDEYYNLYLNMRKSFTDLWEQRNEIIKKIEEE